jgi:hypothetical protein
MPQKNFVSVQKYHFDEIKCLNKFQLNDISL